MLNELLTTGSAQDIANTIQQFYTLRDGRSFFSIAVYGAEEEFRELWVRPHLSEAPIKLANGDQIIRCESSGGYQVDIIVPAQGRDKPATVVIAKHPGARS